MASVANSARGTNRAPTFFAFALDAWPLAVRAAMPCMITESCGFDLVSKCWIARYTPKQKQNAHSEEGERNAGVPAREGEGLPDRGAVRLEQAVRAGDGKFTFAESTGWIK